MALEWEEGSEMVQVEREGGEKTLNKWMDWDEKTQIEWAEEGEKTSGELTIDAKLTDCELKSELLKASFLQQLNHIHWLIQETHGVKLTHLLSSRSCEHLGKHFYTLHLRVPLSSASPPHPMREPRTAAFSETTWLTCATTNLKMTKGS